MKTAEVASPASAAANRGVALPERARDSSLERRVNAFLSNIADHTIAYQRGSFIVVTYGVLVSVGTLLGMVVTGASLAASGHTSIQVRIFIAGAVVSALVAGHGVWWLEQLPSLLHQPLLGLRRIGFMSWGGLLGAVAFSAVFSAVTRLSLLVATDALMRGLFVAYALGRVGCLTYGCCYGRPTRGFGVLYRNPAAKVVRERGASRLPRHPTQLYGAAVGVALFVIVNAMPYLEVRPGLVTAVSFLAYPVGRAVVECYRDRQRYLGSLFTAGHLACLIMFLAGGMILFAVDVPAGTPPPAPLSLEAIRTTLRSAPLIIVAAGIVLVRTGVHWKRVGSW